MSFPSKSGCPMCSIVARASSSSTSPLGPSPDSPSLLPSSPSFSASAQSPSRSRAAGKARERAGDEPEIIWHDENFTVYRERAKAVSSIAHLVIIFNLHVPSLYMLSTSDVPLLVELRELAHRLLSDITFSGRSPYSPAIRPASPISPFAPLTASPSSSATVLPPPSPPPPVASQAQTSEDAELASKLRVGFITPPWKDPSIPVKGHLHAHAYVAPMDRCSWWRSVAYSPLAWYAVEDLVAEIREESTNNRIRSSPLPSSTSSTPRNSSSGSHGAGEHSNTRLGPRPIDRVPNAGARSGTASGHETTRESIAGLTDLESGRRSVGRSSTGSAHSAGQVSYRGGTGRLSPNANSKSPLTPPTAARLAAPSHLDLNATYSYSMASTSSATSTPTKSSFS